jgi:hypothetical protein
LKSSLHLSSSTIIVVSGYVRKINQYLFAVAGPYPIKTTFAGHQIELQTLSIAKAGSPTPGLKYLATAIKIVAGTDHCRLKAQGCAKNTAVKQLSPEFNW